MRILNVSAFFETHGGGVEIVAGQIARALGRRGHDSRLTGAAFDPAPVDEALTAVPLSARDPIEAFAGLPMPIPGRQARKLLEREVQAADALVIHDALYVSSLLARRYARRHRKPWLLIQHIGEIPYKSALLRGVLATANRLVTRPMLEQAPQAVFISDTVRRFFGNLDYSGKPRLLFNGVDSRLFHPPSPGQQSALKERLGMAADRPQLLFVGRFVEKKGLNVLRELARLRPDLDLLMAGRGPIDPAGWNCPNVRLLGQLSREDLAEYFRASDALVLPSVGEGFPLVIQEAMASGLPVFCGRDSAQADPDASGFVAGVDIDLHDPAATARAMAAAIVAKPFGANDAAASYAARTYDWDANAAWLEERLSQLA